MVQKLRLGLDTTARQRNTNEDFNLYWLKEFNGSKSILSLSLLFFIIHKHKLWHLTNHRLLLFILLSLLISKPEHLIAKTYYGGFLGWKVTNIFKAIKVGNSKSADQWKVAVTFLSLHFWCSLLYVSEDLNFFILGKLVKFIT